MTEHQAPLWLKWAREIQALAQTGYHYSEDDYHRERYQRLIEIAAEIVSEHSAVEYAPLLSDFRAQIGYATPRIDVRGAVFHEERLLMVKERLDDGWTLPGGWADVGDVPSEAVEREVWEETGFRVRTSKLIGVYDANRIGPLELFHAYKLVFLCDLVGGDARTSNETSAVEFFVKDEIPTILSGERTQSRHIQDAYAILNFPEMPAVFD